MSIIYLKEDLLNVHIKNIFHTGLKQDLTYINNYRVVYSTIFSRHGISENEHRLLHG